MDEFEKWKEAGRKASTFISYLKPKVKEGMTFEELYSLFPPLKELAFPINVSIDHVAAHDTVSIKDDRVVSGVVKIDLGFNVDWYLSDSAFTIDLTGEYGKMIDVCKDALEYAISLIKPNVDVVEVGRAVEKFVKDRGFNVVENLTGHKIVKGLLHAGEQLPNVGRGSRYKFKEGDVFAVEPFITNGKGYVVDDNRVEIFSFVSKRPVRMSLSKRMMEWAYRERGYLPFSERELRNEFSDNSLIEFRASLRELVKAKAFATYPVLIEKTKGVVVQFEHTVYVDRDGAVVLT